MGNLLNNIGLHKKLTLVYLIVVIVPIVAIGFFFSSRIYELTVQNDLAISQASHNQLQANVLNLLGRYNDIVAGMVSDPTLMNYVDTQYDYDYQAIEDFRTMVGPFIRRVETQDRQLKIRVYSNNMMIAHSEEMSNSLVDLNREAWYTDVEDSTKQVGWAVATKLNQAPTGQYVGCYRVLRDPVNGQVNRVFALFAPETQLYALMAQEREAGKIIIMINDKGQIVSSTERDSVLLSANTLSEPDSSDRPVFDQPLDKLDSQTFVSYGGQTYVLIKSQFSHPVIQVVDWTLVSLIPAGLLAKSVQDVWMKSTLASLGFIFVALLMLFGVARNITRRVQSLIQQMNQVIDSNYKVRIEASGQDEIGLIGQNLSNMVDKTKTLIDEVYEANLRIKDTEIARQRLQTEKRDAEIIALQEQINPHYLFNTLESIRMNLIIANDWKNAEIVEIFADSFRHAMDSTREFYTLGEELDLVRRFFRIQEYRFRGQFQLLIEADETLLAFRIPRLLVQPLVENAIYHGLELKGEPGTVKVSVYRDGSDLVINVEDDGIGISPAELSELTAALNQSDGGVPEPHKRIALRNINSRLRLTFGSGHGLQIASEWHKGTLVTLRMPILHDSAAL